PLSKYEQDQLEDGVKSLRGGLGALYFKASGNGFNDFQYPGESDSTSNCGAANSFGVACQNSNMDPMNTLPWMIVVGSLNAEGLRSSYSTPGSSLWISAPGGEYGYDKAVVPSAEKEEAYKPAMVTTDQSGCDKGYSPYNANPFEQGDIPENASCNYTSTFNGTSSASPVAAGAGAVMLSYAAAQGKDLSWREIKHILATTADSSMPGIYTVSSSPPGVVIETPTLISFPGGQGVSGYEAEQDWITNAAGFRFHNWYGFGALQLDAALNAIDAFTPGSLGELLDTGWVPSGWLTLPIPDGDAGGVENDLWVAAPDITFVEAVQVSVYTNHPFLPYLGIEVYSPGGTKSIVFNAGNGFLSSGLYGKVFLSNAFFGESATGTWKIKLVDIDSQTDGGKLNYWEIRVFGHTKTP
ncbi:MAG: proprotein convertase P-domain-containing protein, partial [Deltaproteobacteria bacterium]|nr:proprotein convertase P-domain-containing protein [Deltaproteobacteria bacterium]